MKIRIISWLLALLFFSSAYGGMYNDQIRSVLSDKCFKCHGPDEPGRKAKLRLDKPDEQDWEEVIARITAQDPDDIMPPPEANKTLSDAQIDLIKKWISEGAAYEPHWAFVPPTRPEVPAANMHPIDAFITQRTDGLSPAADRYTLVRRVYLDLTGLPPSIEEADAFVNDPAPDAWEQLIDRLIASPTYGERWARRWLDLARYADTNGYEKDRPRSIWPYRDWVIRAINAGMPFDQFTIEQLAGDMLPNASMAQRIATGFHRNTMLNEEGGIDPNEFRFHAMTDRVATTGTTWLGLTTGCAQCHTHKYDPITHHEYFGLMAFMNNADEPDMEIPAEDFAEKHKQNLAEADRLLKTLADKWPQPEAANDAITRNQALESAYQDWVSKQRSTAVLWHTVRPSAMRTNLPLLMQQDDGSILVSGDTTKHDIYTLDLKFTDRPVTAIRLEALPDPSLPDHGPGMSFYEGRKGDYFLSEFQLKRGDQAIPIADASHSYAKNKFGKNPVSAKLATDGDVQTGWSIADRVGERHVAVFIPEDPIPPGEVQLDMHFGRHYASSLGRFRLSVTYDDKKPIASSLPHEAQALLAQNKVDDPKLHEAFLMQAPELQKHSQRIRDLRKVHHPVHTLVLRERPPQNPRPTHLHHRGEYTQPQEEVQAHVPDWLHDYPEDAPRDRLGFARWLVDRNNPLTARVVVNRHWQSLFGTGLVKTVDDFGMQGESPSHPELLDWLAVEFMDSGWNMKYLHKLMVTSQTYQQSSKVSQAQLRKDPENRLLTRASRFRVEAEILRDGALKASGLLSNKMFGPPVRPPQPKGITELAYGSPKWNPSGGEDRYRRSVYTHIKRTAPFAMFTTFDGSSGESCIARRERSNSPLQALTLLNDVMFMEAGQAMGTLIAAHEGDDAAKAQQAFRRVLTRPPSSDEQEMLLAFVSKQRERLAKGELKPTEIAGKGASVEQAAWTALARALFNLDEAVTRN